MNAAGVVGVSEAVTPVRAVEILWVRNFGTRGSTATATAAARRKSFTVITAVLLRINTANTIRL